MEVAMAFAGPQQFMGTPLLASTRTRVCTIQRSRAGPGTVIYARERPSVEKLYRIFVEKNITEERAEELGVQRWRRWESGKSCHDWHWKVDEQIYITKGCLQVQPLDCPDKTWFYAGDVVRFPKWFAATLTIEKEYEHCYRFLAFGEGEG